MDVYEISVDFNETCADCQCELNEDDHYVYLDQLLCPECFQYIVEGQR